MALAIGDWTSQNDEIPFVVHSAGVVLAAGIARADRLSDRLAAAFAIPGGRNCSRGNAGPGMGRGHAPRPPFARDLVTVRRRACRKSIGSRGSRAPLRAECG